MFFKPSTLYRELDVQSEKSINLGASFELDGKRFQEIPDDFCHCEVVSMKPIRPLYHNFVETSKNWVKMEGSTSKERLTLDENIVGIPINSQRSTEEDRLFEYLFLRKEIEELYKKIETKKRRIETLVKEDESLKDKDARFRKIPRLQEEKRKEREKTEEYLSGNEDQRDKDREKKISRAIKRKVKEHRGYIREGYTMSEQEIQGEGGEIEKQFVYFKDLGDNKSSRHIMKGVPGLKLTSVHSPKPMEE